MMDKNWKHTDRDPLDVFIGERLRKRRKTIGHSKEELAIILNVSESTIEKFERGLERIGSRRLPILARFLGISIAYFFEGFQHGLTDQQRLRISSMMLPEGESLYETFEKIDDPKIQKKVLDLMMLLNKEITLH